MWRWSSAGSTVTRAGRTQGGSPLRVQRKASLAAWRGSRGEPILGRCISQRWLAYPRDEQPSAIEIDLLSRELSLASAVATESRA